jgi:tRNA threonylcarbamoyladenosine biosynthesis protein TsaB
MTHAPSHGAPQSDYRLLHPEKKPGKLILTIRTDKPEAEIGLYDGQNQLVYETWQAHRELAETIHIKIKEILKQSSKELKDIEGVACYRGPGSFTGLRIGLSVANALAYAQGIPIVARTNIDNSPESTHHIRAELGSVGSDAVRESWWLEQGIKDLLAGQNDKIAIPEYGAEAKTTKQLK